LIAPTVGALSTKAQPTVGALSEVTKKNKDLEWKRNPPLQ